MKHNNEEIYVFYHIALLGQWQHVVKEQVELLHSSGLFDAAKNVYACVLGDYENSDLSILDGIQILEKNKDLKLYEQFTLKHLKEFCYLHPTAKVFYFHAKGVSHKGHIYTNVTDWRQCMEYFNIEKWQDCVDALDEYDTCGIFWSHKDGNADYIAKKFLMSEEDKLNVPRHFSGNFWWVNASLMNKLLNLPFFILQARKTEKELHHMRFRAENFWHFNYDNIKDNFKIKCFHEVVGDLYRKPYPKNRYIKKGTNYKIDVLKSLDKNNVLIIGCDNDDIQEYIDLNINNMYLYNCNVNIDKTNIIVINDINIIDNKSLDWVYINTTDNICSTIITLYDKVKNLGHIIGDNYYELQENIKATLKRIYLPISIRTTNDDNWVIGV